MTEFTKTKMSFALALLGTFFALHPWLENIERRHAVGFEYLGVSMPLDAAVGLTIGLLALAVYCYAVSLVSLQASAAERLGNSAYALSIMVLPLYAGLYVAQLLADRVHSQLAWVAPAVAAGIGLIGFVLSQAAALRLRGRLGEADRTTAVRQLAEQEKDAVGHARKLFASEHFDLTVIELWRAVEARLRRLLAVRVGARRLDSPAAIIAAVVRAGLLRDSLLPLVEELHRTWSVAIGFEPVKREDAERMLHATRTILASLAADDPQHHHRQISQPPTGRTETGPNGAGPGQPRKAA